MRITIKEPELALEVNKVDTPTGAGWCVIMPDDKKVLVKFHHDKCETTDLISEQLLQAIGNEISLFLEADQPEKLSNNYSVSNRQPKGCGLLNTF